MRLPVEYDQQCVKFHEPSGQGKWKVDFTKILLAYENVFGWDSKSVDGQYNLKETLPSRQ